MRCVSILAALLLLTSVAAAQPASGEFVPGVALYVGGGMSAPLQPTVFKDGWNLGWNVGGGVGYDVAPQAEIRALLYYNAWSLDTMGVSGVDGGGFSTLEIVGEVKVYPMARPSDLPVAFYFVGGGGVASAKWDDFTVPGSPTLEGTSETKVAFGVGGGFDVDVSPKAALFVEVKYVSVATDGDATGYLPVRAGARFSVGG